MTGDAPQSITRPSTGLPQWAKILASIGAVIIILGAVLGACGISWVRRLALDSLNPVYITGTVKRIGDFPDSTITRLHPVLALRLPGLAGSWRGFNGVAFGEDAGQMQFNLGAFESEESDPDPQDVIDYCYDHPTAFVKLTAKAESIVDKGKADINGHELVYQIVAFKDLKDLQNPKDTNNSKGSIYKGAFGCMTIGRKVIVVEAAAPQDRPLDINVLGDILRQARSF